MLKIKSIKSLGVEDVYDVVTDSQDHNFILENGVVAHNCDRVQPALRNFMEEYSKNAAFALTCNFKNRIIEPLHSRCTCIDFRIDRKDLPSLAAQFMTRIKHILEAENIEYDSKVVAELIMKHIPDWRRVLNELQRYAISGKIDSGILKNLSEDSFKELIKHMKSKNYTAVRRWVAENQDIDTSRIFRQMYDIASDILEPACIPMIVLDIAKYQYQDSFVADKEINLAAALAEIMVDSVFKD